MGRKKKKKIVLDTNVILHDSSCIYHFGEHDVVIPICVLEELDQFKKGNESINFHARQFARSLDLLSGNKLFNGGVRISKGQGRISIVLEKPIHSDLAANFSKEKPDHHILNTAFHLILEYPDRGVVLVTKDVNLRMKAKSVGIMAQDYKSDHVKNISSLYTGHRCQENADNQAIQAIYNGNASCPVELLGTTDNFTNNEYCILKNGSQSALGVYDAANRTLRRVEKRITYGIIPKNVEQTFALDALLNPAIQLVSISGKAGTGKTLLALAAALEQKKFYHQIFMARPVVPLSNKDIGYLPGDIQSKLDPYMQPLYDNLGVIQDGEPPTKDKKVADLLVENKLVIAPLSYIRGRSLVKIFFIIDEAQNLTPHEVKTIITRAGEGTKIVMTGDIFQIDHPYLDTQSNGLTYLIEKMHGQSLYAHINLEKGERSNLADLASNLL